MKLRWQMGAYTPISLQSIAAGLLAELRGDSETAERVCDLMRKHVRARTLVPTDSGTSALRLALTAAARMRPGRPVALPAWSCYDVLSAAVGAKVPIVWYDIDRDTLQPDPKDLESALAMGPCAVVLVHLFGVPTPVSIWANRIASAGAVLIEDAAQAFGGGYGGRAVGGAGDLVVFSFNRGKGLTGGRAGMLTSSTARGDELIRHVDPLTTRNAGWSDVISVAIQYVLSRPSIYRLPASIPGLKLGQTIYRLPHDVVRPSWATLAMLESNWSRALIEVEHRRRNAARLQSAVRASTQLCEVKPLAGAEPAWLRLPVRARDSRMRDAVVASGRELGVSMSYPRALPDLAREIGVETGTREHFAGARAIADTAFTLPTHSALTDGDLGQLEEWIGNLGDAPSRLAVAGHG